MKEGEIGYHKGTVAKILEIETVPCPISGCTEEYMKKMND